MMRNHGSEKLAIADRALLTNARKKCDPEHDTAKFGGMSVS